MVIETERLLMRTFVENDIQDAFQYLSNKVTMYFIEEPYTMQQTVNFIHKYGISEQPYVYALLEKESNMIIGHIIFHPADYDEIYEIGCIIDVKYQNRGYGYEILSSLIDYGFNYMKLHKIIAETIEGNTKCMKLLSKLQFRHEATMRQHNWDHGKWVDEYYYGLLNSDK